MQRYPRYESGLARPVTELGFEVVEQERGKTSNHHLYYPKRNYTQNPIRHTFRNLVDHVQTMWISEHNTLHHRYSESQIPPTELMIDVLDEYLALNGIINCVYENKTNQTRQVDAEMWERIRIGHGKALYAS